MIEILDSYSQAYVHWIDSNVYTHGSIKHPWIVQVYSVLASLDFKGGGGLRIKAFLWF